MQLRKRRTVCVCLHCEGLAVLLGDKKTFHLIMCRLWDSVLEVLKSTCNGNFSVYSYVYGFFLFIFGEKSPEFDLKWH